MKISDILSLDNVFLNIGLIQNLSNNNFEGFLTLNFNI